jgi:hypothetical protein
VFVGRGLRWERLRWRQALARHIALRHRLFFDRPHGLTGYAIEHKRHRLFSQLRNCFNLFAVDHNVAEDGRGRRIVVPHAVMHDLEVPHSLSGLGIEANQALRVQVVAQTVTAIKVMRWRLHREIHIAQFQVGAHHRPHAGIARIFPRILFPGVYPKLASLRDRVESPKPFACANVVAANVSRRRFFLRRIHFRYDLNDDHITDNHWRRR